MELWILFRPGYRCMGKWGRSVLGETREAYYVVSSSIPVLLMYPLYTYLSYLPRHNILYLFYIQTHEFHSTPPLTFCGYINHMRFHWFFFLLFFFTFSSLSSVLDKVWRQASGFKLNFILLFFSFIYISILLSLEQVYLYIYTLPWLV